MALQTISSGNYLVVVILIERKGNNFMFQTPIAYKFVFILAMMSQVDYYAPRLHLPVDVPIKGQDIQYLFVMTPTMSGSSRLVGGCIQVNYYSFTCDDRLDIMRKLERDGLQSFGIPVDFGESSKSVMERASRMKYVVNTNDVYRLATNWLVAFDIDVEALERVNPPCVNRFPTFKSLRGPVPSPLLTVEWRQPQLEGYDPTEVSVEISAVSGEVLKFTDSNGLFSKRKQPVVRDLDTLLAIPDQEFLKYSTLERSNLLVRFAGIHRFDMHCPDVDDPLLEPKTNAVAPAPPSPNTGTNKNKPRN